MNALDSIELFHFFAGYYFIRNSSDVDILSENKIPIVIVAENEGRI